MNVILLVHFCNLSKYFIRMFEASEDDAPRKKLFLLAITMLVLLYNLVVYPLFLILFSSTNRLRNQGERSFTSDSYFWPYFLSVNGILNSLTPGLLIAIFLLQIDYFGRKATFKKPKSNPS